MRAPLDLVAERPLHARAGGVRPASLRVFQRCVFEVTGHERGYANARGAEIDGAVILQA